MPDLSASTQVFVLDPMLATGGSAAQCVDQIKARGAKNVNMVCIIAAPEGIAAFEGHTPMLASSQEKLTGNLTIKNTSSLG